MTNDGQLRERIKRLLVINNLTILLLVALVCVVIILIMHYTQKWSEVAALPPINATSPLEQYQIAKLTAEIRQIRSDTAGSLFWFKMIGLFVTVSGAVGGYLLGQSRITTRKIDFENRKNIDAAYQAIVQELSDKEKPLLRAAAAVKLGAILESFPSEWEEDNRGGEERKTQMIQLTKKVLAASLALEDNKKVLKTVSIALVLNRPKEADVKNYADAKNLDLTGIKADDAYWKLVDFSGSDFYGASAKATSFRQSLFFYTQFREAQLSNAVFIGADCTDANFKLADLREADLTQAILLRTRFEKAKVHGCKIAGAAQIGDNFPDDEVDNSVAGDGTNMITVRDWLRRETK